VADFFTALLIAFLVSAVASILLLRKQREAMSASLATRAARANEKMAERSAVEDSWDEAKREGDASDGRVG
jgi:mannitol-specific phosphotransferase system IIBC component